MRVGGCSAANPTRLLLIAAVTALATACGFRNAPTVSTRGGAPADVAQLWMEPNDLETRDLFHGAGGAALAPDPSARYELVAIDDGGYSPGYDVRDARGARWSVKLGIEAQPEVVASRVLWAIGYHQPPTYLLTDWQLTGKQVEAPGAGRFRLESGGHKVVDDWSWYENPFVSTQPFKGLLVANLILNNWDWKTSNNKVYDVADSDGAPRRVFVVRDLGASLGKTTFPRFLKWTPLRGMGQGSRNDVAGFEEQALIKKVDGRRVTFDYRGIHDGLVDTLTVNDVVWTCRLMARISDRQWRDAFRAAHYADAEQQRFITKLKSKIDEGLALASNSAMDQSSLSTNRRSRAFVPN
jgi:hypothetical protein